MWGSSGRVVDTEQVNILTLVWFAFNHETHVRRLTAVGWTLSVV